MGKLFRRRRDDELAEVDAEITRFGEALADHELVPERSADPALLADYERALNAYEQAKRDFVGDRDRRDAADVLRALDEGRHALACVDARLAGEPPPPRRPLCFFDPRHGPSTGEVRWTPPEGAARMIDVCAADAIRLAEGLPPIATAPAAPATWPPALSRDAAPLPPRPAKPARPPNAPKPPAPFKAWPQDTPKERRAEGTYGKDVTLQRLPDRPSVLVVRFTGWGRYEIHLIEGGRRTTLLRSSKPQRVVVPLPPSGAGHLRLAIKAKDRWRAWIQDADTVPVLEDRISSRDSFVFRYDGERRRIRMTHRGERRGAFSVTTLTPDFEQGELLLSGTGEETLEAHLPGPTYVQVRALGEWTITLL